MGLGENSEQGAQIKVRNNGSDDPEGKVHVGVFRLYYREKEVVEMSGYRSDRHEKFLTRVQGGKTLNCLIPRMSCTKCEFVGQRTARNTVLSVPLSNMQAI